MQRRVLIAVAAAIALAGCSKESPAPATDAANPPAATSDQTAMKKTSEPAIKPAHSTTDGNPLLANFDTPFGVPPFDAIKDEHYLPAFEAAMAAHVDEVDAIAKSQDKPDFDNTILALEESGALLTQVSSVFFNLNSSNTNDAMQEIAQKVGPRLSKHRDDIYLNDQLYQRVKAVAAQQRAKLGLSAEQAKLLEESVKGFVRGGADLNESDKQTLRKINEELTKLSIEFNQNLLKENNSFELVIDKETDLAGLPESVLASGVEAAKERGHEGKWVYTLQRTSIEPFLQYAANRALREKIYKGYINRGNNDNDVDNKKILARMAALRAKRAVLLNYQSHAHYVLDDNMAKTPENVYDLIYKLWPAAQNRARQEVADMQAIIDEEGGDFELAAWDWNYYAEKVRKARYDFDEDELRPYFQLDDVINGAFATAEKLWGITFKERTDLPTYHEDVRTFEVHEADGELIGIYYTDYYPRASKRGGAWMNSFRKQYRQDGEDILPIIVNVGNFTKPVQGKPSLLRFSEANTLFHEFGHALHGLLSDCTYQSLSGTSVPRDYVEFPSQVMENWASAPEVLALYAKHYETGTPIPTELIDKIQNSSKFNQGFATTEYLAASLLDLDWHTLTAPVEHDTLEFEAAALEKMSLIPEITPRYRSTYFAHIFAGGYSSGYYSYIWSEVLDADAFKAFKDTDIFNPELAQRFRKYILASGGTDDAMKLYKMFRGAEPNADALIERRGLN